MPPRTWLVALAAGVIDARGLPLDVTELQLARSSPGRPDGLDPRAVAALPPLPVDADAALLGQAHEVLLDAGARRGRGAFYTPADVAVQLTRRAFAVLDHDHREAMPLVFDPAVGGGAFALAAAELLAARGLPRATVVADHLWGIDVDPLAIAVTDAALRCWAAEDSSAPPRTHLAVADALVTGAAAFADAPAGGFDVVVGNPPFKNQLESATARTASETQVLRERFGPSAYRYTDAAALFLCAGLAEVRQGGVVALILPQSVIAADDTRTVRRVVATQATFEHVWWAPDPVFAAGVRVWAPVLRRGSRDVSAPWPLDGDTGVPSSDVRATRSVGRDFRPAGPRVVAGAELDAAQTWAPLVSDLHGVPVVRIAGAPMRSRVVATAGFRDQYYGLAPHVREATDEEIDAVRSGAVDLRSRAVAPLVTSGLIGVVANDWSWVPARFAKRAWAAPVVDLAALEAANPKLWDWTRRRLVPKVIAATQARVIEVLVDDHGHWFPSVPTLAVTPLAPDTGAVGEPIDLWRIAAAASAPAVSAWAFHRHLGAALSATALKLSARQLLDLPLPVDEDAWIEAATLLHQASQARAERRVDTWAHRLRAFAEPAARAHDLGPAMTDEVTTWWTGRVLRGAPVGTTRAKPA